MKSFLTPAIFGVLRFVASTGECDSDRNASRNEIELRDGLGKAFPPPSPNGPLRR